MASPGTKTLKQANGKVAPQHWDEIKQDWDYEEGSDGALHVKPIGAQHTVIYGADGNVISKVNPLPVQIGNYYAGKGIVDVGASNPLFMFKQVTVPANTTSQTFTSHTVPPEQTWLIASITCQSLGDVTELNTFVDGHTTGQFTNAGGFTDYSLLEKFGDFFICKQGISLLATNANTTQDEVIAITVRGWVVDIS